MATKYGVSGLRAWIVNQFGEVVAPTAVYSPAGAITPQSAENLTSAGTAQQLDSSDDPVLAIRITAKRSNSGYVYVGDADVSATVFYAELAPGASIEIAIDAPSKIYWDGDTTNDDINWGVMKEG